jgi:hypothetical protein
MQDSNPTRRERLIAFLRRWERRLLGIIISAVAAFWSFDTLTNLAQHVGFGSLSWMLPVCIDAVAAYGMDLWMTRAPAWRIGRALALVAIVVSLAGNVADWIIREADIVAVVLGAIPPLAFAAVLGTMHANAARSVALVAWFEAEQKWHDEQRALRDAQQALKDARRKPARAQAERVEPSHIESGRAEPRQLASVPKPPSDEDARVALLLAQARETGKVPTKRAIMAELGVGSGPALKLARVVRETVTTTTTETMETAETEGTA